MNLEEITKILEDMENEELATQFLIEFNQASKAYHSLLMNLDKSLPAEEWKKLCDGAQKRLEQIIKEIKEYA